MSELVYQNLSDETISSPQHIWEQGDPSLMYFEDWDKFTMDGELNEFDASLWKLNGYSEHSEYLLERIDSGLLSCGNDFDSSDNPFECGFDQYIDIKSDINFLGKKALVQISKEGITRKLMGVKIDLEKIEMMEERPLQNGKSLVGYLRSAVYSPHFKKVVGIAMIKKEYWDKKTPFELEISGKKSKGLICDLPLV